MPLNVNEVDIAVELCNRLTNYPALKTLLSLKSKEVPLNEFMNEDPNRAPWVGVYLRSSTIDPTALPRSYKDVVRLSIVAQASHLKSKRDCAIKLGELNKQIFNCLLEDVKLNNTVDMLNNISTDYTYVETDRENLHFQMAVIDIEFEVRANAR